MKYLKNILFVGLILLLFSTFSYAYWDSLSKDLNQNITSGSGTSILIRVDANQEGKILVPTGAILGPNDIECAVLNFNVNLSKHVIDELNLVVTVERIMLGDSDDFAHLVDVVVQQSDELINDDEISVIIYVRLLMPTTQEEYLAIRGNAINLTLRFSAEKNIEVNLE